MPPPQALAIARQKGLDLVEISPTAVPPVCRIMDYGKYQYQEQKRAREAKRHQHVVEVKEIKFRPKVDEHDYTFKKNHIQRFIEDGDKVKATIFFRGREMAHPEIGHKILMRLIGGSGRRGDAGNAAADGGQSDAHHPDGEEGRPRQQSRRRPPAAAARPERGSEIMAKMKLKTHRGAAKRFKKTATGKFKRGHVVQAAHPDEQDDQAEARPAQERARLRVGAGEARADAAV